MDEAALVRALADGRLAGAGLDVFAEKPLPPDHALWRLDNVIISPHVGGYGGPHLLEGLACHFRANLDRFLADQPLQDRVSLAGAPQPAFLRAPHDRTGRVLPRVLGTPSCRDALRT